MKTILNKWHIVDGIYTRDSWEIPEEGTEVWCTGWTRGQTIKPYGDSMHIVVGFTVYHNDEFMEILDKWEKQGYNWGIERVNIKRYQQIGGRWSEVEQK